GIEMVNIATRISNGKKLKDFGLRSGLLKRPDYYTIKAPVFSFDKLKLVETSLGPEMKSTGEVLGLGYTKVEALYKAMAGSGLNIPKSGNVLLSFADKDKEESVDIAQRLINLGYKLFGTKDSAGFLKSKKIEIEETLSPGEGSPNVLDIMRDSKIHLVFNTPTKGKSPSKLGFKIRRAAVEYKIPCLTSIDTGISAITILEEEKKGNILQSISLNDFLDGYKDRSIIS
ncbi:MAG TPA: carbamoyl-phosphate synthase large subunit, partial [Spirochaetota bacterium]|nr:carbamoyl-phosphate synthase large subunit [Spirochaetota bacterium]